LQTRNVGNDVGVGDVGLGGQARRQLGIGSVASEIAGRGQRLDFIVNRVLGRRFQFAVPRCCVNFVGKGDGAGGHDIAGDALVAGEGVAAAELGLGVEGVLEIGLGA